MDRAFRGVQELRRRLSALSAPHPWRNAGLAAAARLRMSRVGRDNSTQIYSNLHWIRRWLNHAVLQDLAMAFLLIQQ
jgi:hypothetical protein